MRHRLQLQSLIGICLLFSIISCKKNKIDPDKPTETASRAELTKDSIFLYAKEVYLWNTALPTYSVFNPRSFTQNRDEFANYEAELLKITRYTSNENWYSSRGILYDEPKYSYIEEAQDGGVIANIGGEKSYVELDGYGNDIGLGLAYISRTQYDNSYDIYVKYVSPGSPAALKNIKRGSIITKVNGISYGSNFDAEIDRFLDAIDGSSVTLTLYPPSSSVSKEITLGKTRYKSSPIFKDTVYVRNTDNIGYLAYARFSEKIDSEPALDAVFQRFASANVNKIIVDLRYNGGGYVSSAEKLINLIIPQIYNGKLLFTEKYNETMRTGKATILKNQFYTDERGVKQSYFGRYDNITSYANKSASNYLANVQKVVFIVSGSTASASELTINSLKPYMDIKLVGSKTYGKPVGFFPIRIDKYDVYYSMFESFNSNNEGGYYSGINVDYAIQDPFTKELGDPTETNIAVAITYLMNGVFPPAVQSKAAAERNILSSPRVFYNDGFKGMIERPERVLTK
ncbi:peptidase S41 [Pseudopedobacter saltans DSM 12145]|uniref:Peptidase S41 n=1 Tax=Pseudopedobacter saltans (strain ATCC 51119 / DSM 12145 / JCM 21818 / CCUG 39354 / LMG 10337 / NBRC 100064 / NCIMB 13643) TaxID=762903 RepID=F0S7N9_PSESL|nr:S41 family peptidase [Pseudopedobacter saltans]ADY52299.1 peptidase S41 [Pseudopedobacter saltans DSM 12145]